MMDGFMHLHRYIIEVHLHRLGEMTWAMRAKRKEGSVLLD